jgi:integrase
MWKHTQMKGCRALTADEVARVSQAFWGTYAARDLALLVLGIKTGFRIVELLSLRGGDVWQHSCFVDYGAVQRRHMKQKRESRSVIVLPDAKAAMAAWLMELQRTGDVTPETMLFPSRKGLNRPLRPGQARHLLRQAYAACGLTGPLSSHTMRKTFGQTVNEKSGRDLLKTQWAMGHKSPASTVAYLHIDDRDIDALILAR